MARYYCGIDPAMGGTGIVGVHFRHGDANWATAEMTLARVVAPARSGLLSSCERDLDFANRIYHAVCEIQPDVIVIEEPVDAADHWDAQGQGARRQRRGTAFRLGVAYACALFAAKRWAHSQDDVKLYAYPVGNFNGRPGWMQNGRVKHKREDVLRDAGYLARAIGHVQGEFSEHVLMALGLLRFHVQQEGINRKLATMPGVK